MKFLIIFLLLLTVSCFEKKETAKNLTDVKKEAQIGDIPCDKEEAPKVEITDEGINLLEDDGGCKLKK